MSEICYCYLKMRSLFLMKNSFYFTIVFSRKIQTFRLRVVCYRFDLDAKAQLTAERNFE